MGNLIQRIHEVVAPSVKKPRLAVALLMVLSLQPNIVLAQAVSDVPVESALAVELILTVDEPVPAPEALPTIQEVLLEVCRAHGYDVACAKTLLGMAYTETNFKGTAIGDRGRARGWFQIWPKHHAWKLLQIAEAKYPEITTAVGCAEDLRCSAEWTLWYLEKNHYPKYVNYAVQCHNGCNANNGYVNKVNRYAAMFWNSEAAAAPHIALAK